jgi:hypothetical protein
MLKLRDLYEHFNSGYSTMPPKEQKKARVHTRKQLMKICNLTTETATYQWERNGGVVPLSSALLIAVNCPGLEVDTSDYPPPNRGRKPKSCTDGLRVTSIR